MSAAVPALSVLAEAFCVACGQAVPVLPSMTPERLFFLAGASGAPLPVLAAFMTDNSRVFTFDGRIYQMSDSDWSHYLQMRLNFVPLPLEVAV